MKLTDKKGNDVKPFDIKEPFIIGENIKEEIPKRYLQYINERIRYYKNNINENEISPLKTIINYKVKFGNTIF